MKNISRLIIVIVLIIIPLSVYAADEPYNAGFVSGVWYSKTPFFAGETIRIYTAFQNHSGGDIIGAVKFFDNETFIGEANFSAINDRLIETWIDWKVSYGNHSISAKIIDTKRSEAGKAPEVIKVFNTEAKQEALFVDIDTDKDGIGDIVDQDIDNDGLSNSEEKRLGTDPLRIDSDNDKIPDNEDPEPLLPAVAKETAKTSVGSAGGAGGGIPSTTQDVLATINSYVDNFGQKINEQREKVTKDIKSIDNIFKRIDTNNDGVIGLPDFNILMVNWNKKDGAVADYNLDEIVDIIDFNILMVYWS
ncbi:MAG: hypothetical protein Q7S12_02895 [bacterium]|nr:hypothetical protein [bacterium]